jgi:hypothetical protein
MFEDCWRIEDLPFKKGDRDLLTIVTNVTALLKDTRGAPRHGGFDFIIGTYAVRR